jgi:hypothetical protein
MKKKRTPHRQSVSFSEKGEVVTPALSKEKILTAEGYQRRFEGGACPTRSLSLYRGRRQGKGR